jgi:hypothetical protein
MIAAKLKEGREKGWSGKEVSRPQKWEIKR